MGFRLRLAAVNPAKEADRSSQTGEPGMYYLFRLHPVLPIMHRRQGQKSDCVPSSTMSRVSPGQLIVITLCDRDKANVSIRLLGVFPRI